MKIQKETESKERKFVRKFVQKKDTGNGEKEKAGKDVEEKRKKRK